MRPKWMFTESSFWWSLTMTLTFPFWAIPLLFWLAATDIAQFIKE